MEIAGKDNWQNFTATPEAEKPYRERIEELRALVGVQVKEPDYEKALAVVNDDSKLGLSEKDLEVMTLVYRALSSNARRFANEKLLAEDYRGNSASHSLMSILRLDERMSGQPVTAELNSIRQEAALGILMHDVGEICGEFSSLAQRMENKSLSEQPELEGLIVRRALTLAAHAVEKDDERLFFNGIDALKKDIQNAQADAKADKPHKSVREILEAHPQPELSGEDFFTVKNLAHFYERAESGVGFVPHLIKNAEHTQGTRHLLHFMERGNFEIPLEQMPGRRLTRNMEYLESDLGNMAFAATTPLQKQVAKRWRDLMYETTIRFLEKGPPVINREGPSDEPDGRSPEFHQQRMIQLGQHRKERIRQRSQQPGDVQGENTLFKIETKARLIRLYRKAMEADYLPKPGEILGTARELPPELHGLYGNKGQTAER